MDPMIDLERKLAAAMRVEPAGDFSARVRAQISREAPRRRSRLPMLALVAVAGAVVAALVGTLPRSRPVSIARPNVPVLSHHDLIAVAPLHPAVAATRPERSAPSGSAVARRDVLISRSEMLALQRLFAGDVVAPPAGTVSDELVIPQLAIDSISLPVIPEGDQQ